MSKQNSIEFLFEKLWDTPKDKFEWNAILKQAKAMHEQEITQAVYDSMGTNFDPNMGRAKSYYDQNYKFEDGV